MATTGAILPSSAQSISEAPWSDNAWNTGTELNIFSDDGSTAIVNAASYDANDQTFVLKAYGFDFSSIPDGSTIDGVICVVNSYWSAGGASMDLLQLLNVSRAKVGTNQCSTPVVLSNSTSNLVTKGSSSDLWGNALTAAWVKDPDFGVAIGILATAANTDVEVDYVSLEIFYTAPVGSTGQIKAYSGGAFVPKPIKVYNGSIWEVKPLKRWTGSVWQETPY